MRQVLFALCFRNRQLPASHLISCTRDDTERESSGVKLNIALLAICQAIAQSGNTNLATTGALIGLGLTGSEAMSTWPMAVSIFATLLTTIPASLLMARFGRRTGFLIAFASGVASALCISLAVTRGSFPLFITGTAAMGIMMGTTGYLRFAAVELVPEEWRSRAISLVLAGGVIAAIAGPSLSKWGAGIFPLAPLGGGYALWLPLAAIAMVLIALVGFKAPAARSLRVADSLRYLIAETNLVAIIFMATAAFLVMAVLMTATPLAMHHHHLGFESTTEVIRAHMLGMFVPSFFTGYLIRYFGQRTVIAAGCLFYLICIAVNFADIGYSNFMAALILLGVGWNFLFVAASQLLVAQIPAEHQGAAQAMNDFIVAAGLALSVAFTGKVHELIGWQKLNLLAIPLVLLLFYVGVIKIARARQPKPLSAG